MVSCVRLLNKVKYFNERGSINETQIHVVDLLFKLLYSNHLIVSTSGAVSTTTYVYTTQTSRVTKKNTQGRAAGIIFSMNLPSFFKYCKGKQIHKQN